MSTTVITGEDGQGGGAEFASGVATATAAQAAEEASEAAETAEQASETAEGAQEAASTAIGVAYDAQADVAALRGEVVGGFASINERLDAMTAAPLAIDDDGVPAPERTEPEPEPEKEPEKEEKPERGYGSKGWFGS